MKNEILIGLSHERVSQTYLKWVEILDALDVDYIVSHLDPEAAISKANKCFRNAPYHCICRNVMLGQYVDLVERGANVLLIPTRDKDRDLLICDAVRQVPMELANKYGKEIKIINPVIGDDQVKRAEVLASLARKLGKADKAETVALLWTEKFKRVNVYQNISNPENKITILLVGRIDHYMDYTDCNSSMLNKLIEKMGVNIITPSMITARSNYIIRDYMVHIGNIQNRYWDSKSVVNAIYNGKQDFDGILFIHDANCLVSVDEIDYIISRTQSLNIPHYTLCFNEGSQASIETAL